MSYARNTPGGDTESIHNSVKANDHFVVLSVVLTYTKKESFCVCYGKILSLLWKRSSFSNKFMACYYSATEWGKAK